MASGPAGSQKDRGCLSVAELAGIGTGKPATETEPTVSSGVTLNQPQAQWARSVAGGQADGSNWALFSKGALRSGALGSRLLQARDQEAAICIPILQNSMESAQGTNAPESKPERITQPSPW